MNKKVLLMMALLVSLHTSAGSKNSQQIINESIAAYSGECPCPYSKKDSGERCGKDSAWYVPSKDIPLCFESDVATIDAGELNAQNLDPINLKQSKERKFNNPTYNSDKEIVYYGHQLPERGSYSDETLRFYFDKQMHYESTQFEKYEVKASDSPYVFNSEPQEFDTVNANLAETGLVSYLFYEDGKIKVDKKSPKNRFGYMFDDSSQLIANSMGKSMVSYVLGHAICKGYIKDVNEEMDWLLLKDTLYDNQKLIDLINMRAGDQNYLDKKIGLLGARTSVNNFSILKIMDGELKGSSGSNRIWNYNALPPNIVINYIMYKVGYGEKYQEFLNDIFQKKVGINNEVWFVKGGKKWGSNEEMDGHSKSSFYASRYDYLRIAKAMLDDWNNDTCVGKYLKTVYKERVNKNYNSDAISPMSKTSRYGGFFHTDYPGLFFNGRILAMDGYGGQMIWINFDDNRIVVANAITLNFDWSRIVAHPVMFGL